MRKPYLPRHVDSKITPKQHRIGRIISIGLVALLLASQCTDCKGENNMNQQERTTVETGINILVQESLTNIQNYIDKPNTEKQLYDYTKKYFSLIPLIKEYNPNKLQVYNRMYYRILGIK